MTEPAMVPGQVDGLAEPDVLPSPTPVSAPYYAAAARGELVFQRCGNGHPFLYPRSLCPVCHSTQLTWEPSSGRGAIVTFAPVNRPPWNEIERATPYVVVLVRLDEGPQLMSTLENADPSDVRIGQAVRAVFEPVDEDVALVRFVPAGRNER